MWLDLMPGVTDVSSFKRVCPLTQLYLLQLLPRLRNEWLAYWLPSCSEAEVRLQNTVIFWYTGQSVW